MIEYRLSISSLQRRILEVRMRLGDPSPDGERIAFSAWTLGSYLIRDYARHVLDLQAESNGWPVKATKLDKQTWSLGQVPGPLVVRYTVYAADLSVRGAYVDSTMAFWNGATVLARFVGREEEPCRIDVSIPSSSACGRWDMVSSLCAAHLGATSPAMRYADSYWDLIDHPVLLGELETGEFEVEGVTHRLALLGSGGAQVQRICSELQKICTWQSGLFGELPVDRYLFQAIAVTEGYGGLEHTHSTTLICKREDLLHGPDPLPLSSEHRRFLALCSHEYFHLWNVKRIRPAALIGQTLEREAYTRLLWLFEGVTSYYDELTLLRCGLVDPTTYLETLAQEITRYLRTPGRRRQTLEESSFDAWIKLYQPNENTPNAVVSYYGKGALFALLLDLETRRRSAGARSLDDFMRFLWEHYGRTGVGVPEIGIERIYAEATGLELDDLFELGLRSTEELPLREALGAFGVALTLRPARGPDDNGGAPETPPADAGKKPSAPVLGARHRVVDNQLELTQVLDGGAAQEAGLAAGDLLVAIDGQRIRADRLDRILASYSAGDQVRLIAFRRDLMMSFELRLQPPPADTCELRLIEAPQPEIATRRNSWLRGGPS